MLIEAIFDYRNAQLARDLFNSPDKAAAFEQLRSQPMLLELVARMSRAQRGASLDARGAEAEGLAIAQQYAGDVEDDDEAEDDQS